MAKYTCSELLYGIADRCVQVLGLGVTDATPVPKILKEIRAFRIYDGPSRVHLFALAKRIASSFAKSCAVARTSHSDVLVKDGSAPDAEQLLCWRNGYLVFDGTPLADAVAEFNRYSARKVVTTIRHCRHFVSVEICAPVFAMVLWLLKAGSHVRIEEGEDRVHLNTR